MDATVAAPARTGSESASWRTLYRVAAACAGVIFCVALADVALMSFDVEAQAPGSMSAVEWFAQLREHRWLALRNLGLFNVVNTLVELPLFYALYCAHRRAGRHLAAVATMLLLVGAAVYVSRNTLFSLDALAARWAAAAQPERAALAATGDALLALGEDLTPGMFMGFFLTELAGLLMAVALLRGGVFGRAAGVLGAIGFGALLVFNVLAAFVSTAYGPVLALGGIGGLTMMAWYVILALRLLRLARG
jgi:hypothetical protein